MISAKVNHAIVGDLPRRCAAVKALSFCFFFFGGASANGEQIGKYGRMLDTFLEELHVEQYWIAGLKVDWKTGIPITPEEKLPNNRSHCSAFVAAVCCRLGIHILQPPEHDLQFLAKAQGVWLQKHGDEWGWFGIPSANDAQTLANSGFLIIASYRQPPPGKRGHIAFVRPSTKSDQLIELEGPDIIQAGKINYSLTSLAIGFQSFDQAFKKKEIRYFAHYIAQANWKKISMYKFGD
jgi:hypothetical protein